MGENFCGYKKKATKSTKQQNIDLRHSNRGKNEWLRAEREPTVSVKSASQKLNIDSSFDDSALKS